MHGGWTFKFLCDYQLNRPAIRLCIKCLFLDFMLLFCDLPLLNSSLETCLKTSLFTTKDHK
jgi:hypothetical protein